MDNNMKTLASLEVKISKLCVVIDLIFSVATAGFMLQVLYFLVNGIDDGVVLFLPIFVVCAAITTFFWACTRFGNADIILTDKMIGGVQKSLFSSRNISIPLESIDSFDVSKSFIDYIRGGKQIKVFSNSMKISFYCVLNADEFVKIALQQIETFKKQNAGAVSAVASAPSTSLTEKLQELRSLKDSGILSNEQFEQKKQELIAKF